MITRISKFTCVILTLLFCLETNAAEQNHNPPHRKPPIKQNEEFARKRSGLNHQYFASTITSFSKASGKGAFYRYVDPLVQLPKDSTIGFFKKLAALKYLEKTKSELQALYKLNKFLTTNFKTSYLPGYVYFGKNSLPAPLYVSQLRDLSFNAIANNNENDIRTLINNFNLLHIKNAQGHSLFSYAILHKRNNIALMILYKGAYINEQNKYGATPLHIATRVNDSYIAKILMQHGADPLIRDNFNRTAYDYALMNENQTLASLLQRYSENFKTKGPTIKKTTAEKLI